MSDRKTKLEKALKVNRDLFTADDSPSVRAMRVNMELASLHAALIEAIRELENFADYDNPNPPERVCWPACEYMKRSRKTLSKIDEVLGKE